ncbi:hypothetical protein [Streptomyces sp. NPDC001205]
MENQSGAGDYVPDPHVRADHSGVVIVIQYALVHESVDSRLERRIPVRRVAALPVRRVQHTDDVHPVQMRDVS